MFPETTPAVTRALEAAQAYTRAAGAAEVEPLHVLHGLLEEEEGRAALFAVAAGLDLTSYRQQLPYGSRDVSPSPVPDRPLHVFTLQALRQARPLAEELNGDPVVSGDVLLLSLLRIAEAAREHLAAFGFQFAQLEADLRKQQPPPLRLDEPLRLEELTETMDLSRLIDANANRAREGLRVVEDYCRFVLDDAFLSGQLKQLRHDLTAALAGLAPERLLQARETRHDIGTGLSTEAEQRRESLLEVVQANLKRLQEALRSLEEYGKVPVGGGGPEVAAELERLRYRTYTLERALVLGTPARQRLAGAQLYVLLSAAQCTYSLERTIKEAAAGGAAVIQLREKELSDRDLCQRARQVRQWTREAGVLFVVNDRPDIARLVEADGVHLGQDDLGVKEARRLLGPDALIGVSTHNLDQVRQAVLDGASYLGAGPVFPTSTKQFSDYAGLEFVRQALAETSLPAFAIGGVNLRTIAEVAVAGARRVAVSQAIAGAEDPRGVAAALLQALPVIK